jgi:hypothetical protein
VRLGSCRGQALTGRLRVPSLTEAYFGAEICGIGSGLMPGRGAGDAGVLCRVLGHPVGASSAPRARG